MESLGRKAFIVAGRGGPTQANISIIYLFQNPKSLHAKKATSDYN